jgi:hypothetical protein
MLGARARDKTACRSATMSGFAAKFISGSEQRLIVRAQSLYAALHIDRSRAPILNTNPMATMTIRSTLMMILIPVGIQAQIGSRLVGYAFRSMNAIQLMVLSDSLQYTYTGERGGDLTTELKFDRSYQWSFDQFNVFALHSGHSRAYDSNDLVLTDSSLTLNVAPPVVTDYFRWTYDGQGRPATQVQFVGSDSTSFSSYSYTPSGKPAVNFRSQLSGGIWYDTTEDYTYNAMGQPHGQSGDERFSELCVPLGVFARRLARSLRGIDTERRSVHGSILPYER